MCVDELINLPLGIFSARFGHEDILETTGGQASLFGDVTGMMVINVDPGRRIQPREPDGEGRCRAVIGRVKLCLLRHVSRSVMRPAEILGSSAHWLASPWAETGELY
jgi:hypothetical protein